MLARNCQRHAAFVDKRKRVQTNMLQTNSKSRMCMRMLGLRMQKVCSQKAAAASFGLCRLRPPGRWLPARTARTEHAHANRTRMRRAARRTEHTQHARAHAARAPVAGLQMVSRLQMEAGLQMEALAAN